MSLRLSDLTKYSDIVIQCHDNPDADALASGHAIKWYLKKKGISARFVYGGRNSISKSNLVLMINRLGIKADHVMYIDPPELLITVDCQYGESNVTKFDADNVAVIDHHQITGRLPALSEIRSNYGSCSTIIYELLQMEHIDINSDVNLSTALYYGLMTDTNGFSEISHPSDKDLRDLAKFSRSEILMFKNSNLSRDELKIAGKALENARFFEQNAFAVVESEPCDPNILGIISDMLLEVDSIATCLVYSILPSGVKLSVRSCVKEVKASELAAYLAEGLGGGGGHLVKAGGLLKRDLLEAAGVNYDKKNLDKFLIDRMESYFRSSEIIYANDHVEDPSKLKHYTKKEVAVGYVRAKNLAGPGHKILIRTLEGDVDVRVEEDLNIIIGINGEIYPCRKEKFESSYKPSDDKYIFPGEYPPAVIDTETGERIELLPFAASCIAKGGSGIYARELDHRVKVFTAWDPEKYYLGIPGDYLAVRADDLSDVYIIAKDIFYKTYALSEE
ncbi:MAG: DHH family phosphoesterase [Lachnospiraceae bacterium]|nr:DHH family phosphoesterase [Lachnospiraceae bacterium]